MVASHAAPAARLRRHTDVTTLPIRNVPMQLMVEGHGGGCSCHPIGEWDDEPTQTEAAPLSLHEQEAIDALQRFREMRTGDEGLSRLDWQEMRMRLLDARLQLSFGLSPGEALSAPLVGQLLVAWLIAGDTLHAFGRGRTPLVTVREPVSRERVWIPILHV